MPIYITAQQDWFL